MADICNVCDRACHFGSGRFVNRIPADENYICGECIEKWEREFDEHEFKQNNEMEETP